MYCTYKFLPVVYGCETWSLTLREELRLRVFEKRVFRRIFWPKRYEVKGGWRKLHNEALYDPYSSPNIVRVIKSRRMGWAWHVARMGRVEAIQGFDVETWGKVSRGRPRDKWENNIKMDLQELGCVGMAWIELTQDRDRWQALVNAVMNVRIP